MKHSFLKNTKKVAVAALILATSSTTTVTANNIAVSNSSIVAQNTVGDFTHVKFDVSWENSWRTSTLESNWDAAYVFVKYRIPPMNTWYHATLNYVDGTAANDGNTNPTGGTINTTSDGKGAFLYRSANGIGNISFTNARLRWNYGVDGLSDQDSVEICVFAIEMVYVPQGAFYLGDGCTGAPVGIQGNFESGTSGNPFYLSSEASLTLGGGGVGSLGNNNTAGMVMPGWEDFNDVLTKTLPAAFPKGYDAFYCMKYEVTQGMYADFLNKLNLTQATTRYMGGYSANYQSITGTHPNFNATSPDRPLMNCNYADLYSYLDWSGLRPMTEMEYEKASRGSRGVGFLPTPDEYAWGDVSIRNTAYTVTNSGLPNETVNVSNSIGNAADIYTNNARPYRVGAFAASKVNPTRVEAGASYYGIMELSGNQYEYTIAVGRAEGRPFLRTAHGNGSLDGTGRYNVTSWPSGPYGTGVRGGSYVNYDYSLRTSSREYAHYYNTDESRYGYVGGRGVRTAQ